MKLVELEALCDGDRGITYGIVKVGEFVPDGVPVLRGGDIGYGKLQADVAKRVTPEVSNQFRRTILTGGELVMNLVGDAGHVALVPAALQGSNVSRDVAVIPLGPEVNHEYVLWYLRSQTATAWLSARMQGSVTRKINLGTLKEMPIPLLPRPDQDRLASFLSAIDRRIDVCHEMNQTLEDIARAIFKSWFIDFDPVHAKAQGKPTGLPSEIDALFPGSFEESAYGPVPAGWLFGTFGEELSILETGRRPKGGVAGFNEGVPSIGAQSITRIGEFDYSQTKFVPREFFDAMRSGHLQSHDVLLYKDGGRPGEFKPHVSMFANGWPYEEMAINEHVFRMRGTNASQEYLFCWLSSDPIMREMEDVGTGAAIPGITRTAVQGLPFVGPSQDIMDAWTAIVHPMFEKIFGNCAQSRTLSELRDTLLPKLISGDRQIPQVVVA